MNNITYALVIHICLTTIYCTFTAASTAEKSQKETCSIENIFSTSTYTKRCSSLLLSSGVQLPPLEMNNINVYLCTGIAYGVNKICKFNSNLNPDSAIPNKTAEFDAEIKKSCNAITRPQLCHVMGDVLSNSSYEEIITQDLPQSNIKLLNIKLLQECDPMCMDVAEPFINPLCSVLLWVNKLLVNTDVRIKNNEQQQNQNLSRHKIDSTDEISVSSSSNKKTLSPTKSLKDDKNTDSQPSVPKDINNNLKQANQNSRNNADLHSSNHESNGTPKPLPDGVVNNDQQLSAHAHLDTSARSDNLHQIKQNSKEIVNSPSKEKKIGDVEELGNDGVGQLQMPEKNDPDPELLNLTTAPLIPDEKDEIDGESEISEQDLNSVAQPGPPEPPQHFFAYFMAISLTCLICYIGYHKKHKILAIIFEGRKSRGGRSRKRPNTASYRKLDCNLEEAVTSQCNSNVTHSMKSLSSLINPGTRL